MRYIVTEPGLFAGHELPADWGMLVRDGRELQLARLPVFHEVEEAQRLALLHRIALAATRAVQRAVAPATHSHPLRPHTGRHYGVA